MAVTYLYFTANGNGAVAAAGTGQSTAAELVYAYNRVTGADGTACVRLPIPYSGDASQAQPIIVVNTDTANTLPLYPPSGGAIDGGSTDAAVTMAAGEVRIVFAFSTTDFRTQTLPSSTLSGVTAGTVTASKSVVVDANKDITAFRLLGADEINFTSVATPAAAGTGVAGDAQLITAHKTVQAVTGADGTKTVILPATGTGLVAIYNNATSALPVFPGSGDTINAQSANASVSVPPKQLMLFIPLSSSAWATHEYVDLRNAQTIAGDKTISGTTALTGRVTTTDGVSSGTARVIGGVASSSANLTDAVTAVASNNSFVDHATTYSIPANTLKAGSVCKIRAKVRVTDASGADTLTAKLTIGSTVLVTSTALDAQATHDYISLSFDLIASAAPGASVTCDGFGRTDSLANGAIGTSTIAQLHGALATNGALVVKVSSKWSSNTASTSANLDCLSVEII